MDDVRSLPTSSTSSQEEPSNSCLFALVTKNLMMCQDSLSLDQFLSPRPACSAPQQIQDVAATARSPVDEDPFVDNLPNSSEATQSNDAVELPESMPASKKDPVTSPDNTSILSPKEEVADDPIQEIERCCLTWRAGKVKPYWLVIDEPKFGQLQGCALRIQLDQRVLKVYSVDTIYPTPDDARKACALAALADGVLDFIQHGDGRTETVPISDEPSNEVSPSDAFENTTLTVQAFYETLPKPFPEHMDGKTAQEINASSWLNMMIQSARGSMLNAKFIWTMGPKLGLHGCLLRLERPMECRSYLVDAKFTKRTEAKAAVCLQAMWQGIGDYIRRAAGEVKNKIPVETRRLVTDIIYPTILSEYRKVLPGSSPSFEWISDKDACGCILIVQLSPSPSPEQVRRYSVPVEYRNRNDAKTAVMFLAAQQGVIDFIRFRGQPPPPDYVPFDPYFVSPTNTAGRKRKSILEQSFMQLGNGGMNSSRKRFKLSGGFQGNFWATNPQGIAPYNSMWNNPGSLYQTGSWFSPRTPGPAELGSVAGSAYMGPPAGHLQPALAVGIPTMYSFPQALLHFDSGSSGGVYFGHEAPVNGGDRAVYYASGAPQPPPSAVPPAEPYHIPSSSLRGYGTTPASGLNYPPYHSPSSVAGTYISQFQQPYQMEPVVTPSYPFYPGHTVAQGFVPYHAPLAQGTTIPISVSPASSISSAACPPLVASTLTLNSVQPVQTDAATNPTATVIPSSPISASVSVSTADKDNGRQAVKTATSPSTLVQSTTAGTSTLVEQKSVADRSGNDAKSQKFQSAFDRNC
ncbi:hypothetical protein BKA93DRAFT_820690 [Sparassis latifolia]